MKKLIIPILTPYLKGDFDPESMISLMAIVEEHVDIYVPCLSSGEGDVLKGDIWEQVVECVKKNTKKPVFAGILNKINDVGEYIDRAKKIDCEGVVLPLGFYKEDIVRNIINQCSAIGLEIIFYNIEGKLILDEMYISKICSNESVVGFKDSSMNRDFLSRLVKVKGNNKKWGIFQGMEMAITKDSILDGYFISLANVEPEFCADLKLNYSFDKNKVREFVEKYNLKDDRWFLYLKKELAKRGTFASSEKIG